MTCIHNPVFIPACCCIWKLKVKKKKQKKEGTMILLAAKYHYGICSKINKSPVRQEYVQGEPIGMRTLYFSEQKVSTIKKCRESKHNVVTFWNCAMYHLYSDRMCNSERTGKASLHIKNISPNNPALPKNFPFYMLSFIQKANMTACFLFLKILALKATW